MKEYKLTAWPDLPAEFRRTAYRRIVSELSQRFATETQLQLCSGIAMADVRKFLTHLQTRDLVESQEAVLDKPRRWPWLGFIQAWQGRTSG